MNCAANFLSILGLFFGFASIIFSLEGQFTLASWAIITSVIFDGLDGQVARRNPSPSEFGKELDSLADVVSFGVSPSLLGYIFICRNFHILSGLALFIYLASSVQRLAKYNITPKEKLCNYFYGLPTTASGGILASFILIHRKYSHLPAEGVFLLAVLCLSFLMVSRVRYLNLDGLKQALGRRFSPFCLLALIAFTLLPEVSIFALFLIYLLFSPFMVKRLSNAG